MKEASERKHVSGEVAEECDGKSGGDLPAGTFLAEMLLVFGTTCVIIIREAPAFRLVMPELPCIQSHLQNKLFVLSGV